MRINKRLTLKKEKHEKLGEILVIGAPRLEDGTAYFITDDAEGDVEVGIRLTKKTALKLAAKLIKLAKS